LKQLLRKNKEGAKAKARARREREPENKEQQTTRQRKARNKGERAKSKKEKRLAERGRTAERIAASGKREGKLQKGSGIRASFAQLV
jgi:hypothetical protein